jgi:SAM-dependent methyltransferase
MSLNGTFPVNLVCFNCDSPLAPGQWCSCGARSKLEIWNGIPRTLFGQPYWGECSQETMNQLLGLLDQIHWREALDRVAKGQPVQRHLTASIGPDFIYSFPWQDITTVLDIGAGMGFLAGQMATFGKSVVALEAVPERALFLAQRAKQDGLTNLFPLIANGGELPFQEGSFDLITLNGVFEYVGLWGEGNPKELQEALLSRLFKLLRPNGFLYIGIETRYGYQWWAGNRDHSGLKYTSLMPRFVADLYCRLRRTPFYGSQRVPTGYRTYIYSPREYEKMVRQAGFKGVEVLGCYSGYNEQRCVYPLDAYRPRLTTRGLVDQPSSILGALRRTITDSKLLYEKLEDEIILFAEKERTVRPLVTSSPRDGSPTVTQLSTHDKVCLILFSQDKPGTIAKTAKNSLTASRLATEFDLLSRFEAYRQPAQVLSWPKPLARKSYNGHPFYEYEYVEGTPLHQLLATHSPRLPALFHALTRLCELYADLCVMLSSHNSASSAVASRDFFKALADSWAQLCPADHPRLAQQIEALYQQTDVPKWNLSQIHGDLAIRNVILTADDRIVLLDWENASSVGLIAIDLIRLLYDTFDETRQLNRQLRNKVIAATATIVEKALARLGFVPNDYPLLEALFVSNQVLFLRSRETPDPSPLLKIYRSRYPAQPPSCLSPILAD